MDATQTPLTMAVKPSSESEVVDLDARKARYAELCAVIDESQPVLIHVYEAVHEIKTQGLWKIEFASWDQFIQKKFGYSGKHMTKMLGLGKYLKSMDIPKGKIMPTMNQTRELKRLGDPEKSKEVWKLAKVRAKNSGREKPTLEDVATIVDATISEDQGTPTTMDWAGNEVHDEFTKVFELSRLISASLAEIKQIRKRLLSMPGAPGSELISPGAISQGFGAIESMIKAMMPYSMCLNPNCEGGCAACHGHGWVNEKDWKEQLKALKNF